MHVTMFGLTKIDKHASTLVMHTNPLVKFKPYPLIYVYPIKHVFG